MLRLADSLQGNSPAYPRVSVAGAVFGIVIIAEARP